MGMGPKILTFIMNYFLRFHINIIDLVNSAVNNPHFYLHFWCLRMFNRISSFGWLSSVRWMAN